MLPLSSDPNGYSITEFEIYALGIGLMACIDIDTEIGSINDLAVLKTSRVEQKSENGTEDVWWIDEGQDYPRLW
jgi:hypothetical protein